MVWSRSSRTSTCNSSLSKRLCYLRSSDTLFSHCKSSSFEFCPISTLSSSVPIGSAHFHDYPPKTTQRVQRLLLPESLSPLVISLLINEESKFKIWSLRSSCFNLHFSQVLSLASYSHFSIFVKFDISLWFWILNSCFSFYSNFSKLFFWISLWNCFFFLLISLYYLVYCLIKSLTLWFVSLTVLIFLIMQNLKWGVSNLACSYFPSGFYIFLIFKNFSFPLYSFSLL